MPFFSFNRIPVVNTGLTDDPVVVVEGQDELYTFAADAFTDPDGDVLTYSAKMADGSALPSWITFNPTTRTFTIEPTDGTFAVDNYVVKVTATDPKGSKVSDTFEIKVEDNNDSPIANPADGEVLADTIAVSVDEDGVLAGNLPAEDPEDDLYEYQLIDGDTIVTDATDGNVDGFINFDTGNGGVVVNVDTGAYTYTPDSDFNGSDSFQFRVKETETPEQNPSNTVTMNITVNDINDEPSATNAGNQTILEDAGAQTVANFITAFLPDAIPNSTLEDGQTPTYTIVSTTNDDAFAVDPAIAANGTLTYTLAADWNGSVDVTFNVQDSGGTDNGGDDLSPNYTFTITADAVNDEPTLTLLGDQVVAEDVDAQTVGGFATLVEDATVTANSGLEDTQVFQSFIITTSNNAAFESMPTISTEDGTLYYTLADNWYGDVDVTVQVVDNGGTDDGGDNTSQPQTFTITATADNDAPILSAPAALSADEDVETAVVGISLSDVDISTTGVTPTQNTYRVVLTCGNGDLLVDDDSGATVLGNDTSSVSIVGTLAQVNTELGSLTYTGDADYFGADAINVVVDDTGTVGAGANNPFATIAVTVDSVNDEPAITGAADQSILEDAGAQTVAGFTTFLADAIPNTALEAGETATYTITDISIPAAFAVGPAIAANGTLTYTIAEDWYGSVDVTFEVQDSGGTPNGGDDTSPEYTFTIDVDPVNDQPEIVFNAGTPSDDDGFDAAPVVDPTDGSTATITTVEDSGAQTVDGFITLTPDADAHVDLEDGQSIDSFIITTSNDDAFATGPALDLDGNLTYTLADDWYGDVTVSVQVVDDGGTADDGVNTSAVQTFTITATAVNDGPVLDAPVAESVLEDDVLVIPTDGFVDLSDPDFGVGLNPETDSFTAELTVSNGNIQLDLSEGAEISDGSNNSDTIEITGTLAQVQSALEFITYNPDNDFYGSDALVIEITDNGSHGDGGPLSIPTHTIAITVNPENDNPVIGDHQDETVAEDTALTVADFNLSDVDLTANLPFVDGDDADSSNDNDHYHVTLVSLNGASFGVVATDGATDDDALVPVSLGTGVVALGDDVPDSIADYYAGEGVDDLTGASFLYIDGTLSDIQATLNTLIYQGAANWNGTDTVTIFLSDFDEFEENPDYSFGQPSGAEAVVIKSFDVDVTPVNDAPSLVVTLTDGPIAVYEDYEDVSIGGLLDFAITDVDDNDNPVQDINVTITLETDNGGVLAAGGESGTTITITDSIANIQAALANLEYTPDSDFYGTETVTVSLHDGGNIGTGNILDADDATFEITVNPVNDDPIITGPGIDTEGADYTGALIGAILEDEPFSINGANLIQISDNTDLGVDDEIQVTLEAVNGTLTMTTIDGLAFTGGDGTSDATMTFTGTVADLNTALTTLSFVSDLNYFGPASITVTVDDLGQTGSENALYGGEDGNVVATFNFDVDSVNDAPTIEDFAEITIEIDDDETASPFDVAVDDVENDNVTVTVTLSDAANGELAGGGFVEGPDGTYTLTDVTEAAAQNALSLLVFTPTENQVAPSEVVSTDITVEITDGMDTTTYTDAVTVATTSVNDAPTITADPEVTFDEDNTVAFNLGQLTAGYGDVDFGEDLADFASIKITDLPDNGTLQVFVVDSWVAVNLNQEIPRATIETGLFRFVPVANENGDDYDTFNYQVSDGADYSGDYTMTINITPVNDAPDYVQLAKEVDEDLTIDILVSDILADASDVEGDTVSFDHTSVAMAEGSLGSVTFNAGADTVIGTADDFIRFDADAFDSVAKDTTGTATIEFDLYDDGSNVAPNDNRATVQQEITVNGTNDAPTIVESDSSIATTGYVEDEGDDVTGGTKHQVILDSELDVLDVDTADYLTTAVIKLTLVDAGEEFLTFDDTTVGTGEITIQSAGEAGGIYTLTLTSAANEGAGDLIAAWENALQAVKYYHSGDNPTAGNRSVTIQINDGDELSAIIADGEVGDNTIVFAVTPTNDSPTSVDGEVTTDEDVSYVFSTADFGDDGAHTGDGNDYEDPEGTQLATVKITGLATNGTLEYDTDAGLGETWVAVAEDQEISAADITAGRLRFTPVAEENGEDYSTFTFQVSDGTSYKTIGDGGEYEYTMTVNVDAQNDAPTVSVPGDQAGNEDEDIVFTGPNAITVGDATDLDNEADPSLYGDATVTVSVTNGVLTVVNQDGGATFNNDGVDEASIEIEGTIAEINAALDELTYTPTLNYNGVVGGGDNGTADSVITVQINDNGNIDVDGAGDALTVSDTINIELTPDNDAPVAGPVTGITVDESDTTANLWATILAQVSDPDLAREGDVITITSASDPRGTVTLNTGGASITYTADADFQYLRQGETEDITFNYTVSDTLGLTDSNTVTVGVVGVNEQPSLSDGANDNAAYTENGAAVVINDDINLSDDDIGLDGYGEHFLTVVATIDPATIVAGDVLDVDLAAITSASDDPDYDGVTLDNIATVAGGTAGVPLTITVKGGETLYKIDVLHILQAISFENTGEDPDLGGTKTTRDVAFVVTDTSAQPDAASNPFVTTIDITPLNDAPNPTTPQTFSIAENTPNAGGGIDLGDIVGADPDSGDYLTYTIVPGGDSALFTLSDDDVDGGGSTEALYLNNGVVFDYETDNSYTITVRVTDDNSAGSDNDGDLDVDADDELYTDVTVNINVTNVNEAPTSIDVSGLTGSLPEGTNATDYSLGSVSTSDPDAGDSFTYTSSNIAFYFTDSTLYLNAGMLDFEATQSYSTTITSKDSGGLSTTQGITVTVTDVNEDPVISNTAAHADVDDDAAEFFNLFSAVTIGDPDAASVGAGDLYDDLTITVTITQIKTTGGVGTDTDETYGTFTTLNGFAGANGVYTITDTAANVQAAIQGMGWTPESNKLDPGEVEALTFKIDISDNDGGTDTDSVTTLNVVSVNDAPTSLDDTGSVNEGSSITQDFNCDDDDTDNDYTDLTYTLGVLTNTDGGAGTGSLDNNGDGTYTYSADDFDYLGAGVQEHVTFTVDAEDDSAEHSNPDGTVTITVTGVNDAPTISSADITGGTLGALTVDDVDTADWSNMGIEVTLTALGCTLTVPASNAPGIVQVDNGSGSYTFDIDNGDGVTNEIELQVEADGSWTIALGDASAVDTDLDAFFNAVTYTTSNFESDAYLFVTADDNNVATPTTQMLNVYNDTAADGDLADTFVGYSLTDGTFTLDGVAAGDLDGTPGGGYEVMFDFDDSAGAGADTTFLTFTGASAGDIVAGSVVFGTLNDASADDVAFTYGTDDILLAELDQSLDNTYVQFADGSKLLVDTALDVNEDTFIGSSKGDYIMDDGNAGFLRGLGGDDVLDGGAGNDIIYGDAGNDTIIGGLGNDILVGGADADTFMYTAGVDNGSDYIINFQDGTDTILFSDAEATGGGGTVTFVAGLATDSASTLEFASAAYTGGSTVITLAGAETVTLLGVEVNELNDGVAGYSANDFNPDYFAV